MRWGASALPLHGAPDPTSPVRGAVRGHCDIFSASTPDTSGATSGITRPMQTARHGGNIIAEVLASWKIPSIFTLCGGHISPILVGAQTVGIRVIDCRDEQNAVFAADAVARM